MDLRQVEYVVAVVDHDGFTRASAALHVAQPSLSQGIRRLEAELGVPLFDRVGRGVQLTAAGEAFLGPARQLLRDRVDLAAAVAATRELHHGTLDLVALPTLAADPLAPIVGAFRRAHPGVQVVVREAGSTAELVTAVRDGTAELGITDLTTIGPDLTGIRLSEQEIFVAHPPGQEHPARTLRRLAAVPLVVGPTGTSTRDLVDAAFRAGGFTPIIAVESGTREAVVPLVLAGAGAAFLHAPAALEAAARGAVVAPVSPPLSRPVGLVHAGRPLSPAATRLVALALDQLTPGVTPSPTR
jgi:LysR family transcriptional regulator, carnitine catabolism transcriptional activator